jgi:hypothetical protein
MRDECPIIYKTFNRGLSIFCCTIAFLEGKNFRCIEYGPIKEDDEDLKGFKSDFHGKLSGGAG